MNTDDLLEMATNLIDASGVDGNFSLPNSNAVLLKAAAVSLVAIALELQRANDLHEDDRSLEAWKMEHGL